MTNFWRLSYAQNAHARRDEKRFAMNNNDNYMNQLF